MAVQSSISQKDKPDGSALLTNATSEAAMLASRWRICHEKHHHHLQEKAGTWGHTLKKITIYLVGYRAILLAFGLTGRLEPNTAKFFLLFSV